MLEDAEHTQGQINRGLAALGVLSWSLSHYTESDCSAEGTTLREVDLYDEVLLIPTSIHLYQGSRHMREALGL